MAIEAELKAVVGDPEAVLRSVLASLGITEDDLTTEQYTDAVAAARPA
ncbi:hypothetical protein [Kitasatospora sp. NPDC091207]